MREYEKSIHFTPSAVYQQERRNFADAANLRPFDLREGERVEAKDPPTNGVYKWTITAVYNHVFICRRNGRGGHPLYRAFQRIDYQRGAIKRV